MQNGVKSAIQQAQTQESSLSVGGPCQGRPEEALLACSFQLWVTHPVLKHSVGKRRHFHLCAARVRSCKALGSHRSRSEVCMACLPLGSCSWSHKEQDRKAIPTSCEHLWAFADAFVVVCILCAKIISWLANAADFAGSPCESFKVNPGSMQRKK